MIFEEALQNVAFAVVRLAAFMANGFLFGLPVVLLLVLRPSLRAGADDDLAAVRRVGIRLEGLVQAALWGSVVASALVVVLQAVVAAGLGDGGFGAENLSAVVDSSFGRWYLLRVPLLAGLVVLLGGKVAALGIGAGADPDASSGRRIWWAAWIFLALALLATSSFSGHASVSSPRALALVNDIVHLAFGAVWFAGIVVLAGVMPDAWRRIERDRRVAFLTPVVVRFSKVALVSIAMVAATGTANSWFNVEAVSDVVESGYGRVLLSKVIIFLGIVVLGALNHFYVRRRLAKAAAEQAPTAVHRLFKKTIAIELALALLILGLTSVLVGSARTRPSALDRGGSISLPY